MDESMVYVYAIGAICSGVGLYFSFVNLRRLRLSADTPTSKVQGVFVGLVEVKGVTRLDPPLKAYLSDWPCVLYQWEVEERWSRTVTSTERDSKGNTRTVTRRESGWTTVAQGGEASLFEVQDDTGCLQVNPEGARLDLEVLFNESCTPSDSLYYAKGPRESILNSDDVRRFVEKGIRVDEALYVIGHARERQDKVAPEIAADASAPDFLISVRSEERVSRGFTWKFVGCLIFSFLVGFVVVAVREHERRVDYFTDIDLYLAVAGGISFIFIIGWILTVYNSLVSLYHRVVQARSQIDVQLKYRHDLISRVIEVVKGYATHEKETQEAVAQLRRQMEVTPPGVAGEDPRACSAIVQIVSERYPDLKAGDLFLDLQKRLSDTEDRIALARGYYNEIASFYNTRLEIIPDRFIAGLAGLREQSIMGQNGF